MSARKREYKMYINDLKAAIAAANKNSFHGTSCVFGIDTAGAYLWVRGTEGVLNIEVVKVDLNKEDYPEIFLEGVAIAQEGKIELETHAAQNGWEIVESYFDLPGVGTA